MNDRTIMTVSAVVAITIVAIAGMIFRPNVVVLAPTISAILLLLGYEGVKRFEDMEDDN